MDKGVLEHRANLFRALADPVRLQILEFLKEGEKCVCEIIPFIGRSQSTTSKNLDTLYRSGILERREDGRRTFYKIRSQKVLELLSLADSLVYDWLSYYAKTAEYLESKKSA
ncbi:MAG: winged helix-turn-helix transcriptional regulator [Candidatus Verstraetearchaeota archaeon]|jgi:ArsR family transcriptional regulator|nr:winged helix-turn-helix transcriptional regulator [Candidatus Verstraetearchaeota archaeon]